jgi:hypothetical protein
MAGQRRLHQCRGSKAAWRGPQPAGLGNWQASKPQAAGVRTVTGVRHRATCTQAFCCRCRVLRWSRCRACRWWAGLRSRTVSWRPASSAPVSLKWPNDVLVDAHKAAGILIETTGHGNGLAAIIGCGVNLAHHPQDTRWPATHLGAHRRPVDPAHMLTLLAACMETRLEQWNCGAGQQAIMKTGRNVHSVSARGCGWPMAGKASSAALRLLARCGFNWMMVTKFCITQVMSSGAKLWREWLDGETGQIRK